MDQIKARDLSAWNSTRITISCIGRLAVFAVAMVSALFIVENEASLYDLYAQPNLPLSSSPEEFLQQAKESLSTLMKLRNQSTANASSSFTYSNDTSLNDSSSRYGDLQTQQFATDVSGRYSNPNYGILDFVIPDGWYGSERQWSGDKSITLDMHPGTEAEFLDRLLTPPSSADANNDDNDIIPTMTLEANDKKQLQMAQSFLSDMTSTSDTVSQCSSLEPNSTTTINGKLFNVSTMECTYSSNDTQMGDSGVADLGLTMPALATIEVLKRYEHESPDKEYSLQLTISKDVLLESQNVLENAIDTHKYTPIIDTAAKTLKLK